ncbi:MAG TPA: LL-diaminopimelate aminotransferase [Candidatus Binataceae bacterium]|nr:LL-diaminopimelate aminotransferase [Candidatus Binataceae bacterium]
MQIKTASRLSLLPPYLFAELDRLKREVAQKGIDVISLGIGDPDLPTPSHIVESLKRAADKTANHRYPDYEGLPEFRAAAANWFNRRFGHRFDPNTEVCALIGSKEGIANFSTAVVDPGDIVLIPDPGYPVYYSGCVFNGGEPYFLTLRKENGFKPDLEAIPSEVAKRAKLLWLNYPNNPTGATADRSFFEQAVKFCLANNVILAHDSAYSEIAYDGYRAPSIFDVEGSRDCAIEFQSLSKTFSMTGWRVGFAIGNAQLIAALGKVKTNMDSGVFQAVQEAAMTALEGGDGDKLAQYCAIYKERRDQVVGALRALGLECDPPRATFYIWARVPHGYTSKSLAERVLKEAGVVITPGSGFGKGGEGYVRLSLTVSSERLKEAVDRIKALRL